MEEAATVSTGDLGYRVRWGEGLLRGGLGGTKSIC